MPRGVFRLAHLGIRPEPKSKKIVVTPVDELWVAEGVAENPAMPDELRHAAAIRAKELRIQISNTVEVPK
jgi:hypothetical protein